MIIEGFEHATIFGLFERVGEKASSNFFVFLFIQILLAQCWKSFLGCS